MENIKEVLEKRIIQIEDSIKMAINNHSMLVGHLEEAKFLLKTIFKSEQEGLSEVVPVENAQPSSVESANETV